MRTRLFLASSLALVLTSAGALAQTSDPPAPPPPPAMPPPPAPPAVVAAPAESPAPVACASSPCDQADQAEKTEKVTDHVGTVGVRTTATRAGANGVGVAFAGRSQEYSDIGVASGRESIFWAIGGGGSGFEGAFGGALAGGFRVPFDRTQGSVFRIGLEGYILGNNNLYASMFEIPQGQIGYQLLQGNVLFEVGGKAGLVLTGRYRDPQADLTRKFSPSPEWGAYTSLHFTPLRIDASFTRIEAIQDAPSSPVDVVDGAACSLLGHFSLCADARYERGELALGDHASRMFQSVYGGLTVGFNWRTDDSRKSKAAKKATAKAYSIGF